MDKKAALKASLVVAASFGLGYLTGWFFNKTKKPAEVKAPEATAEVKQENQ